jgi:hypothetical protein
MLAGHELRLTLSSRNDHRHLILQCVCPGPAERGHRFGVELWRRIQIDLLRIEGVMKHPDPGRLRMLLVK